MADKIEKFRDEYAFLSNFFPSTIRYNGKTWKTVEHAYAAAKTFDENQQEMIRNTTNVAQAKRLGRSVTLRKDWDDVKLSIMEELLVLKFSNPLLRPMLLATGDAELIEGNNWNDYFWGVCRGKGQNHLGKLLMKIRNNIREETTKE